MPRRRDSLAKDANKKKGGGCAGCARCAEDVIDTVVEKVEDVKATIVDMADDIKTAVVGKEEVPQELIDAETPEHLWFTPKAGWPRNPAKPDNFEETETKKWEWTHPHHLCPTAKELPKHYDKKSLGILRVEVLECKELPQLLQLGRADPYAVIIFEGVAARNHTISNDRFPKWDCFSPRAFKFPIRCPYSTVHMAINDDDRGEDDPLGRVVLELGLMRADTVYDCWYALQYSSLVKHVGKRGHVRLRYSITFYNAQQRLIHYAVPPPTFVVPFRQPIDKKDSLFAYRGPHSRNFRWVIFDSHLKELKEDLRSLMGLCQSFIFYKLPFLSLFVCVVYQYLVSYPKYIPGCLPLIAVASVIRGYISQMLHRDDHPIKEKHTLLDMQVMLFGQGAEPIQADPVHPSQLKEEDLESDGDSESSDDSDEERGERKGADSKAAAKSKARQQKKKEQPGGMFGLGKLANAFAKPPSLEDDLEELKKEVEEEIEDMRGKITQRTEARLRRMDSTEAAQPQGFTLNPLAKLLFPVQTQLGMLLFYTRTLKRMLSWHDPFLTLQLCLLLLVVWLALSAIGFLLELLPWGVIFEWTFRLAGLALFGPHMYWVGLKVEAAQAAKAAEEEEYQNGSPDEREAILKKHREAFMKEAKHKLDEAVKRDEEVATLAESSLCLADDYATLIMKPIPTAGALRFGCQPNPQESRAYPLTKRTSKGEPLPSARKLPPPPQPGGAGTGTTDLV